MKNMKMELIKKCDSGFFRVTKMYLREQGERGYLIYRMLRPILKMRYSFFRRIHKPAPWLSPTSILFFQKYLKKDMVGAEFGSGSSTLFLAPRIAKLYSVEHNKMWYEMISKQLEESNFSNVDYRFVLQNESTDFKNETFDLETGNSFEVRRDYVNYFQVWKKI